MAVPKTLKEIPAEKALKLIDKHLKAGTGFWEGTPNESDFIYKFGTKPYAYKMIRPPVCSGGNFPYETGTVQF